MVADAAVTAQANPPGYRFSRVIIAIKTLPGPAASATALPLMPEKTRLVRIFACASPPLTRPTQAIPKSNRRSVIVPAFMTFAAKMNRGIAIKTLLANNRLTICAATSPTS